MLFLLHSAFQNANGQVLPWVGCKIAVPSTNIPPALAPPNVYQCSQFTTFNSQTNLPNNVLNTGTDVHTLNNLNAGTYASAIIQGNLQVSVNDGDASGQFLGWMRENSPAGTFAAPGHIAYILNAGGTSTTTLSDPDVVFSNIDGGSSYYALVVGLETSGTGKKVRWISYLYTPPTSGLAAGTMAFVKTGLLGHSINCTNPNVDVNGSGRVVLTWKESSVITRTVSTTWTPPGNIQTIGPIQLETEGEVMAAYGFVNGNKCAQGKGADISGVCNSSATFLAGGALGDPISRYPVGTTTRNTLFLLRPLNPDVAIADGTGNPVAGNVGAWNEGVYLFQAGKMEGWSYTWGTTPSNNTTLPICSFVYLATESNAQSSQAKMIVRQVRWGSTYVTDEEVNFSQFGSGRPRISMPRDGIVSGNATMADYEIVQLNSGSLSVVCIPEEPLIESISAFKIANWGKYSGVLRASGVPNYVNQNQAVLGGAVPAGSHEYRPYECSTSMTPITIDIQSSVNAEPAISFSSALDPTGKPVYSVAWTYRTVEAPFNSSNVEFVNKKFDILAVSLVNGAYYVPTGQTFNYSYVNRNPVTGLSGSGHSNRGLFGDQSKPSIAGRYGYTTASTSNMQMSYAYYHNFPEATGLRSCNAGCPTTGANSYALRCIPYRRGNQLPGTTQSQRKAVEEELLPDPAINSTILTSPNPFNDSFTLTATDDASKMKSILVTDVQGKAVKKLNSLDSKSVIVDLKGVEAGLYIIQVETGSGIRTVKVIKEGK